MLLGPGSMVHGQRAATDFGLFINRGQFCATVIAVRGIDAAFEHYFRRYTTVV